ncbi:hypothetical protein WA026_016201 [Henosepilachna vigintioctopunctata]|uniref:Uncharacterized protein n=1 Tax=Henosepilachna vigintioctopunctata TaxID=420089 RepID=A0AAW1TVM9_9CUCU
MEVNSGGAVSSPIIFTHLTPKSQRTYNRHFSSDHIITSPPISYSNADLTLLSKEIQQLKTQFSSDPEMTEQAEFLSQSVQQLFNNNGSSFNPLKEQKKKIEFKYPQFSVGPFLVIVESSDQNLAEWEKYAITINQIMDSNAPESLESFQEMIQKAANECFQKVKDDTGKNKFKICWWDKDLQKIVKERQTALLKYLEQPSLENYLTSKRLQAYSKKSIKEKKRNHFCNFVWI